jgi:hypothetical protein
MDQGQPPSPRAMSEGGSSLRLSASDADASSYGGGYDSDMAEQQDELASRRLNQRGDGDNLQLPSIQPHPRLPWRGSGGQP